MILAPKRLMPPAGGHYCTLTADGGSPAAPGHLEQIGADGSGVMEQSVAAMTWRDRALLALIYAPVLPVLLFLLGWWGSLKLIPGVTVSAFALGGLGHGRRA